VIQGYFYTYGHYGSGADTRSSRHEDDSEERSTSDSPVVPPISLNEAALHLTALFHLLETITVTELPTNGATLQVEIVQHQLSRLRTGSRLHSLGNKKTKAICPTGLPVLMNSQT